MQLSNQILGKATVDTLQARVKSAVLTIGTDTFTRTQLAKVACFNFSAAAILTKIFSNLGVKNTADVFRRVPPQHLAVPGLGSISLATLGAAFEAKGLGNLTDYIDHHRDAGTKVVTFDSIKRHSPDAKAEKRETKIAKSRKHGRNAVAHNLRTRRFIDRHPKTRAAAMTN